MKFFGKREEESLVLVFDIANDSIAGACVELSPVKTPRILISAREYMNLEATADAERLVESVSRLLKKVCDALLKESLKNPAFGAHKLKNIKTIHCTFSSPWYLSETKVVSVKRDRDFTVTSRLIRDLISSEEKAFEKAISEGAYAELFGHEISVIERKVMKVLLNGYAVDNPHGKVAHEVEIDLFTSVVSTHISQAIENIFRRSFGIQHAFFHSSSLMLFSALRDLYPEILDFIIADITGELTEMTIATRALAEESASFPLGRSHLIRSLSKELKVNPELATSFITLSKNGNAGAESKEKIDRVMKNFGTDWKELFMKTAQDFKRGSGLRTVFIVADESVAQFFEQVFSDVVPSPEPFSDSLGKNTARITFQPIVIDSKKLTTALEFAPGTEYDTSLALSALFTAKT